MENVTRKKVTRVTKTTSMVEEPIKEVAKDVTKTQVSYPKGKVLVVIPYCADGAQGRELEFAIAGWRKYFKEDYLIVVVGSEKPEACKGDDIVFIQSERVDPSSGNYRQHLDYVKCFRKVHECFPDSKGFVFTADDGYALNPFDLTDVKVLKIDCEDMGGNANSLNGWQRDNAKTRALLIKEGLPIKGFTTHIPQWYEWDKLEALWDKYDMDNNSYVFESLYFNTYYGDRIPVLLEFEKDIYRCPVTRPNANWARLPEMFKKKIWIFNTIDGYCQELEDALANYYGI